jgi:hypothetical protein
MLNRRNVRVRPQRGVDLTLASASFYHQQCVVVGIGNRGFTRDVGVGKPLEQLRECEPLCREHEPRGTCGGACRRSLWRRRARWMSGFRHWCY